MGLKPVRGQDRVILLGWSEPRPYEGGVIGTRSFPAGRSMRVVVGTDEHGFVLLKVKSVDVDHVAGVLANCGRGVSADIEYTPGTADQQALLHKVDVLVEAKRG